LFALLTSALTSVLLGLGLWKLGSLTQHVESAATLLLFVPGVLTLFVIRPGEHQFATTAYSGVRVLLLGGRRLHAVRRLASHNRP
jgi:hypothetical protein